MSTLTDLERNEREYDTEAYNYKVAAYKRMGDFVVMLEKPQEQRGVFHADVDAFAREYKNNSSILWELHDTIVDHKTGCENSRNQDAVCRGTASRCTHTTGNHVVLEENAWAIEYVRLAARNATTAEKERRRAQKKEARRAQDGAPSAEKEASQ
tara:strand:- start:4261 stop:4722 length:462 start_codon:yes stop_codon:yes gene_type:complete